MLRGDVREVRRELREVQKEVQRLTSLVEHFMYRSQSEHEKLLLRLEVAMLKMERRLPPADETKVIE